MVSMSEEQNAALCDFLLEVERDRAAGGLRPLAHYLGRFSRFQEAVAREYLALADASRVHAEPADLSGAAPEAVAKSVATHRQPGAHYTVERELGRGGMGAVLKVRDAALERDLAMKVHLKPGAKSRERFLREARITSQLDHPGIVPVHEVGATEDGRSYFTMRLVHGATLKDVIRQHAAGDAQWNLARCLDVFVKVCDTMAFAHSRGVVHRDLKPSNVMVGEFGAVYVVDWGLARSAGGAGSAEPSALRDAADPQFTLDGDVLGTPSYMAPEQARGQSAAAGPEADVYAVGAMLYHLLAGKQPFSWPDESTTSREILRRVIAGPPEPIARIRPDRPKELIAIADKAMAREPGQRYPGSAAMAADFRAFLDQRVVSAYPATRIGRALLWVRRNRALAAAVAAVAVALVALLAATWVRIRAADERSRIAALALGGMSLRDAFAAMAPLQEAFLPALKSLSADAHRLTEAKPRYEALLAALRGRALPLDPTAPAELAFAAGVAAGNAASEKWIAEMERLIAGHDAGTLRLEEPRTRAFYVDQIRIHRNEIAARSAQPLPHLTFRFADPFDQVVHDSVVRTLGEMAILAKSDRKGGVLALADRAVELLEAVPARTPPDFQQRWDAAIESIADVEECPRYGGLRIRTQSGLLPLGRDPATGLWEFLHLLSGEPPRRAADGRLELSEATGIVLVLIPPGDFCAGAQCRDPKGTHFDPYAGRADLVFEPRPIAAFLLGKYELTQAQWRRLTTVNPSTYQPGAAAEFGQTLLHPVERLTFHEAELTLARYGLALPTDAQWEYAARAGTATVWYTGDDPASTAGHANTADRAARAAAIVTALRVRDFEELDDGFPVHAPVDALQQNPFGLHGMLGNVREWCRDKHGVDVDRSMWNIGTLEWVGGPQEATRPVRGGSFRTSLLQARSAATERRGQATNYWDDDLGARAARQLEE